MSKKDKIWIFGYVVALARYSVKLANVFFFKHFITHTLYRIIIIIIMALTFKKKVEEKKEMRK